MITTTKKHPVGRPRGQVPGSRREGKKYQVRASIVEAQVIDAAIESAELSANEFFIRAAIKAAQTENKK